MGNNVSSSVHKAEKVNENIMKIIQNKVKFSGEKPMCGIELGQKKQSPTTFSFFRPPLEVRMVSSSNKKKKLFLILKEKKK